MKKGTKRKQSERTDNLQKTMSGNAAKGGWWWASRRQFLKIGAGVAGGVVAAGAISYFVRDPLMNAAGQTNSSSSTGSSTSASSATSTSSSPSSSSSSSGSTTTTTTSTGTASSINQQNVFLILNTTQVAELAAIVSTIIPTDSNGPGGTEAGVIYFIDRQLATDYGKNGNMYQQGSVRASGTDGSDHGQFPQWDSHHLLRRFHDNGAHGGYTVFLRDAPERLLAVRAGRLRDVLQQRLRRELREPLLDTPGPGLDRSNDNKPTSFNDIIPSDFFNEVFRMTWCGFLMDPLYGGNQGMVGWELVGFNGVNMGNFYGEGHTTRS